MKENQNFYRSPMFYVGDKYKLIAEISSYFPENINCFVEPFVGGGSVFMNVAARKYLLNDIDSNVIELHKFLAVSACDREVFFNDVVRKINDYGLSKSYIEDIIPNALKLDYKKTYIARYNKEGYLRLRNDFNSANKTDFLSLYLLLIYGFNRMLRFNSKGEFNLPVGNVDFNKNVVNALNDYFNLVSELKIDWNNVDYKDFLQNTDLQADDFVYLDPPYLITSSQYNKLWTIKQEKELLDLLDELNDKGIRFAISNVTQYKGRINDIFLLWAKKYNCHSIKSNYISYHDNSIKNFNEVLITNY